MGIRVTLLPCDFKPMGHPVGFYGDGMTLIPWDFYPVGLLSRRNLIPWDYSMGFLSHGIPWDPMGMGLFLSHATLIKWDTPWDPYLMGMGLLSLHETLILWDCYPMGILSHATLIPWDSCLMGRLSRGTLIPCNFYPMGAHVAVSWENKIMWNTRPAMGQACLLLQPVGFGGR